MGEKGEGEAVPSDEARGVDDQLLFQEHAGAVSDGSFGAMVDQTLDVTFLESIKKDDGLAGLMRETKDALLLAVGSGDLIDVDMLLEELRQSKGSLYFTEVLNSDSNDAEANSLHVAAYSSKGEIVRSLLNTYRENSSIFLRQQLDRVSDERAKSVSEIVADISDDYGMSTKLDFQDPRIVAIDNWFDEAIRRAHRVHEFRQEIWWTKCLSSRDRQGRTPLHYAVLGGNIFTLEAFLTAGHGRFTDKAVTKYFDDEALYSTTSGHIVGSVHSSALSGGSTKDVPVAETSFNLQRASLSSASWDLASTRNNDAESHRSGYTTSLDFEVIIPWVLRNMLKRAQDMGSRRDLDGVRQLRILAERACVDGGGHTLIASELRALLQRLGIRLTADVIRELCRQYPGDAEMISDKWERYVETQGFENSKADSKKCRDDDSDSDAKDGYSSHGRKRDDSRSDSKSHGTDSDRERGSGSKRARGDSDDDVGDKGGSGSKGDGDTQGDDEKSASASVDEEESDLGLDVEKLLNAISDGKALITLDLGPEEDSRLMASKRLENQLSVPACVSVGGLVKARRNALNLVDQYGCTPLLYASSLGKEKMVDLLCRYGADVGITSRDGLTSISVAAHGAIRNRLETSLVSWLRDSKGDAEGSLRTGKLLQSLGKENDPRAREALVANMTEYFPHLQAQHWSYSMPCLSWAVVSSAPSVLRDMLSGAGSTINVNEADLAGRTALHECVSLLSRFDNAGVGSSTLEALQMLEILLNNNADPNVQTVSGRSPLHELFCRGQNDATSSSSHQGVKVINSNTMRVQNKDAFERARAAAVRLLLHWGADPLLPDRQGNTALHHAARMNEKRPLLLMLNAASTTSKSESTVKLDEVKNGQDFGVLNSTADDKPARTGAGKVVRAEYARNPQGRTCLHAACQAGAARTVNLLARWDADTPATSFAVMVDKQHLKPSQLLSPSASSSWLDTPWGLAREGDFVKLGQYFNHIKDKAHSDGTDAGRDAEEEALLSLDKPAEGKCKSSATTLHAWMDESIDSKSRRLRWTALHCVVVGWAESLLASKGEDGKAKAKALGLTLPKVSRGRAQSDRGSTRMKNNAYAQLSVNKKAARDAINQTFKSTMGVVLQQKAYVDCLDWQCRTPLMMAVAADLPTAALEALVAAGAELETKDLDGNTALHYAYAYGSMGASVWLEAKGANGDASNLLGYSPFQLVGHFNRIKPPVFAVTCGAFSSALDAKDEDDDEVKGVAEEKD